MATLVDYMLGLFSNPETAEAFIKDPDEALGAAGLADVSTDQLQAVAASVAPTGLTLGGLDPIKALQQAVSEHHGIEAGLDATPEPASAQEFASVQEAAEGRFGVGFDAVDSSEAPVADADAPADSLLLPYFEVDVDDAPEPASAQDFASTQEAAEGRFGVGFDAVDSSQAPVADADAPAADADAPADSLLLPYFEVDLEETPESGTLFQDGS
jgi:hypothetical protein